MPFIKAGDAYVLKTKSADLEIRYGDRGPSLNLRASFFNQGALYEKDRGS